MDYKDLCAFAGGNIIHISEPEPNDNKNYFNNKKDIKDLFKKSNYTSLDDFIDNEYIRYKEYINLIDIVIISIKKHIYYRKDYIEKLIFDKPSISVIEYDFLSDSNKNKYYKSTLFFLNKTYYKK